MTLIQIQESVRARADAITLSRADWPCRRGCDECCRHLAAPPRVSEPEWRAIAVALELVANDVLEPVRARIRESAGAVRPVVCPLLDLDSGTCLVYQARPVACRAYGFYAEGEFVLGCSRIESVAADSPEVIWGNHRVLEDELHRLGPATELAEWLEHST